MWDMTVEAYTLSDVFHHWSKKVWRYGIETPQSNATQEEQDQDGSNYKKRKRIHQMLIGKETKDL